MSYLKGHVVKLSRYSKYATELKSSVAMIVESRIRNSAPQGHRDFFLSHNLSGIPQCFMVTMGVIDERRERIEKDPAIPFRIQEIIVPILQEAKHIRVASSTLLPEHQHAAVEAVRNGACLQVVTSERIIQELRLKNYSSVMSRYAAESSYTAAAKLICTW